MDVRRDNRMVLLAFIFPLLLVACARSAENERNPDVTAFVADLGSMGVTVQVANEVQQSFLRARGARLCLSGAGITQPAQIQVHAYDDAPLAEADIRQISPDGGRVDIPMPNGGTAMMINEWIAPPHFFHQDRLVVLYLGSDPAILEILSGVLGPQVAGAHRSAQWGIGSESC